MASIVDKVGGKASLTPVGQNVQTLNARLDSERISASINRLQSGSENGLFSLTPTSFTGSREHPYSLFEGSLCFTFNSGNGSMRKPATPLVLSILNGIDDTGNMKKLYAKISFVGVALSHVEYKGPDTRNPIDVAIQHGGTTSIMNNGNRSIPIGTPLVWKLPTDDQKPGKVYSLEVTTVEDEVERLNNVENDAVVVFAEISRRWFATSLNSTDPGEVMHIRLK